MAHNVMFTSEEPTIPTSFAVGLASPFFPLTPTYILKLRWKYVTIGSLANLVV